MKSKPKPPRSSRAARLEALKQQDDYLLRQRIRELLALPMHERTRFLRVRLPNGGSAL
jgi:hypothetical protein